MKNEHMFKGRKTKQSSAAKTTRSAQNKSRRESKSIEKVIEEISTGAVVQDNRCLATLSFPVCRYRPKRDNAKIIVAIANKRQPALLLCAGWTTYGTRSLRYIEEETKELKSVIVLETFSRVSRSYRVFGGVSYCMGHQIIQTRDNCTPENLSELSNNLESRTFQFGRHTALLLVCGEIAVVKIDDGEATIPNDVPNNLAQALRANGRLILNPTHTRMGRFRTLNSKRKFLSGGGIYVSASNWRFTKHHGRKQKISGTLHSVWKDGKSKKPGYIEETKEFCYREWNI